MNEQELVEFEKQLEEFINLKKQIKDLTDKSEVMKKSIIKMMGDSRSVIGKKYKAMLVEATKATLVKKLVIDKFAELSKQFNIELELDDKYYKHTTYDNFYTGEVTDEDKKQVVMEQEKKNEPKPQIKEEFSIDLNDIKL